MSEPNDLEAIEQRHCGFTTSVRIVPSDYAAIHRADIERLTSEVRELRAEVERLKFENEITLCPECQKLFGGGIETSVRFVDIKQPLAPREIDDAL